MNSSLTFPVSAFMLQCDSETEIEEKVRTAFFVFIHKPPEVVGSWG